MLQVVAILAFLGLADAAFCAGGLALLAHLAALNGMPVMDVLYLAPFVAWASTYASFRVTELFWSRASKAAWERLAEAVWSRLEAPYATAGEGYDNDESLASSAAA